MDAHLVAIAAGFVAAVLILRMCILSGLPLTPASIHAASITTIEAAFLSGGNRRVAQLRTAASAAGRTLDLPAHGDIRQVLARRGFAYGAGVYRKMGCLRLVAVVAAITLAVVLHGYLAAHGGGRQLHTRAKVPPALAASIACALGAMLVIAVLTCVGDVTAAGRRALEMRRSAYPLHLIRDADALETLALYGGRIEKRRDDSDGGTVWIPDGQHAGSGCPHGAGDSGAHAHGCASSSCGSSCGGGGGCGGGCGA